MGAKVFSETGTMTIWYKRLGKWLHYMEKTY